MKSTWGRLRGWLSVLLWPDMIFYALKTRSPQLSDEAWIALWAALCALVLSVLLTLIFLVLYNLIMTHSTLLGI